MMEQRSKLQLSSLQRAPTSWSWGTSDGTKASVSYDIWLGASPDGKPASSDTSYHIVIWLSDERKTEPIGSPIQSGISLASHNWTLWSGPNQNWNVFTFITQDGDINNFSADLKDFLDFLVQNHGVSSSQYLQSVRNGTEPHITESGKIVTSAYSINTS